MKSAFFVALAMASVALACDDTDRPFPAGDPSLGGPGGIKTGEDAQDAAIDPDMFRDASDATVQGRITGRLCLLRTLDDASTTCELLQQTSLQVRVQGGTFRPTTGGTFDLVARPNNDGFVYVETRTDHPVYYGAVARVRIDDGGNAQNVELQVATRETVNLAIDTAVAPHLATNGIVVLRFRDADPPGWQQLLVASEPQGVPPYYDTPEGIFVRGGSTGADGTVVYFNMPPGPVQVTVTHPEEGTDSVITRSFSAALIVQRRTFAPPGSARHALVTEAIGGAPVENRGPLELAARVSRRGRDRARPSRCGASSREPLGAVPFDPSPRGGGRRAAVRAQRSQHPTESCRGAAPRPRAGRHAPRR